MVKQLGSMHGSRMRGLMRRLLYAVSALALAGCADIVGSVGMPATNGDGDASLSQSQAAVTLRLARASRAADDLTSAISLYRQAASIKPVDPALMVELGDTLLEAKAYDDAIDVYSQIEANATVRTSALIGLAKAEIALAEPAKALKNLDLAQGSQPKDPRVLINRGVALDLLERHADAQACYRAVLATTPRHLSARNNLALSLALSGQFPEALDIITPMARSPGAPPRIRQNLAVIYGLMGKRDEAAALSRKDLDPATAEANMRFLDLVRAGVN
jgi:Flp pilus assembly protein TadD